MRSELCDLLFNYFNGSLSEQDEAEFKKHLKTCSECQEELSELEALTSDLPYLSEPVKPPAGMKERVLNNVLKSDVTESPTNDVANAIPFQNKETSATNKFQSKKKNQRLKFWIAGLAACLVVSLGANILTMDVNKNASDNGKVTTKNEAKVLFTVPLSPTPKGTEQMQATAAMVKNDHQMTLVIEGKGLKPISGSQVYQVWLLKNGKPQPAGSFKPKSDGSGAVAYKLNDAGSTKWDGIAISVESAPDHTTPKGTIYMQGSL